MTPREPSGDSDMTNPRIRDEFTANDIPAEIVSRDQWILSRRNSSDKERDKKPVLPTDPTNMKGAFSLQEALQIGENPDTHNQIAQRLSADEWFILGFTVTEDDPLVFIDWDDIREPEAEEKVASLVRDEVARIGGYVEVSTTGTGLHQFVTAGQETMDRIDQVKSTGVLPLDPSDWPGSHVEVYKSGRYAVMTGDVWSDFESGGPYTTLQESSDEVDQLLTEYFPLEGSGQRSARSKSSASSATTTASRGNRSLTQIGTESATQSFRPNGDWVSTDDPTVEQIVATGLASDDDAFNRLWRGDTTGYPTQSEADCALVSKLWYYADDRELVDTTFRRSDLMRDKWGQRSYRNATLRYTLDSDRHEGQYLDPAGSEGLPL